MGRTAAGRQTVWENWAANQRATPVQVREPATEAELAEAVRSARREGLTVKAVGSGHSFTDVAVTGGVQLRLSRYGRVLRYDAEQRLVEVQAGITLRRLNDELAARGLALANLGDVDYQTISGAISTGTHGTGGRLGGLATQVAALRLVNGEGEVISCSPGEEAAIFPAARVGLGALGVISTVTLKCVPAFNLHAVEAPMRLDRVLDDLDELVDANDHFEAYWVPQTRWCLTKINNRTTAEPGLAGRLREQYKRIVAENLAFGAGNRLARAVPGATRRIMRAAGRASVPTDFVDRSDKVFVTRRWVRFCEMEYSVPRTAAAEALERLAEAVAGSGLRVSFPVEVRFVAGDDIALSTAHGGDRCYIAAHMYKGVPYEQYFRLVEGIMRELGGRPHWGKLHFLDHRDLEPIYPEWAAFQAVRDEVDPGRTFSNAYTRRVLGS